MAGNNINLSPNGLLFLLHVQSASLLNPRQCYCSCPHSVKKCIQGEKYIHEVAQLWSSLLQFYHCMWVYKN